MLARIDRDRCGHRLLLSRPQFDACLESGLANEGRPNLPTPRSLPAFAESDRSILSSISCEAIRETCPWPDRCGMLRFQSPRTERHLERRRECHDRQRRICDTNSTRAAHRGRRVDPMHPTRFHAPVRANFERLTFRHPMDANPQEESSEAVIIPPPFDGFYSEPLRPSQAIDNQAFK